MRRPVLGVVLLAITQVAAVLPPRPIERLPPPRPPVISAPAWILYDDTSDLVLAGVATDEPRPMASTTKIMTALLAIESGRLDEVVTVSTRAAIVGEASIGLVAGERVPLEMLVYALLIRSGNDAATAVAEHLSGSVEGFVESMNARAAELGMASTSFANPHGLDAENHFSSPSDLLTLALVAMQNTTFAEMVATTRYRITDAPDGRERIADATNHLLTSYRGTFGVKTGFTFRAGLVIVAGAEREGRTLYTVVMGADGPGAHFADAATLLDHGFEDHRIVDTILRGSPLRVQRVDEEQLAALARLQTLLFVNAMEPISFAHDPVEEPEPDVLTADLPDLAEAFRWLIGAVLDG
jgi:serine-type D-Ala-D-Ala carboxypeptidase (penicillin-binding protein 5/6)